MTSFEIVKYFLSVLKFTALEYLKLNVADLCVLHVYFHYRVVLLSYVCLFTPLKYLAVMLI
jgi:hypothetical protein